MFPAVKRSRHLLTFLLAGALWPAGAARGAAGPGPLEFRGVITTGGVTKVGLLDRESGAVVWAKVPAKPLTADTKPAAGVAVRDYDPAHNRLTVDYHGGTYSLALAEAVLVIAPPPPEPAPAEEKPADGTAPEGENPPAAAPEVQRRQSLRQVEVANALLRESGADESLLLQGNPTAEPSAPVAPAASDTVPPSGPPDVTAVE
jgi:hypothetical protein